jgi:hypothetical protein
VRGSDGTLKDMAVKVLRPGIEQRFKKDLDSYFFAARMIERFHAPSRRLRPVAIVDTLAQSTRIEMDLRLEARGPVGDGRQHRRDDPGFRVPEVDWQRTGRDVLTLEWIDGIADERRRCAQGRRPRPAALGFDAHPDLPAPCDARRLLPCRHASGQSVRRPNGRHRRGRSSASWAASA